MQYMLSLQTVTMLATAPASPVCALPVTFLNMDINEIRTAKQ